MEQVNTNQPWERILLVQLKKIKALNTCGAQLRTFKDSVSQTKESGLGKKKYQAEISSVSWGLKLLPWIGIKQGTSKNDKEG